MTEFQLRQQAAALGGDTKCCPLCGGLTLGVGVADILNKRDRFKSDRMVCGCCSAIQAALSEREVTRIISDVARVSHHLVGGFCRHRRYGRVLHTVARIEPCGLMVGRPDWDRIYMDCSKIFLQGEMWMVGPLAVPGVKLCRMCGKVQKRRATKADRLAERRLARFKESL